MEMKNNDASLPGLFESWKIKDKNGHAVIGHTELQSEIKISSMYQGLPATRIWYCTFSGCIS